jgi:hypothetical protein
MSDTVVESVVIRSSKSGVICSSKQGSIREGVSGRAIIADLFAIQVIDWLMIIKESNRKIADLAADQSCRSIPLRQREF